MLTISATSHLSQPGFAISGTTCILKSAVCTNPAKGSWTHHRKKASPEDDCGCVSSNATFNHPWVGAVYLVARHGRCFRALDQCKDCLKCLQSREPGCYESYPERCVAIRLEPRKGSVERSLAVRLTRVLWNRRDAAWSRSTASSCSTRRSTTPRRTKAAASRSRPRRTRRSTLSTPTALRRTRRAASLGGSRRRP